MKLHRGITLLEVLIVTVIVTILCGLGLSVSSYAKSSAKQASCTSNMHQLYIALELYCQDSGGWEHAPKSLTALQNYAAASVFSCPDEHSLTPDSAGKFPAAILWGGRTPCPMSPFRISYAYIRDYPSESDDDFWQRGLGQPNLGVLACQWHGDTRPGYVSPNPNFLLPRTGVVLRTCLDGHLMRWQRTDLDAVTTTDMFIRPLTVKQVFYQ